MAKRGVQRDPELLAHQEWLGYLQPVGLVVAPAAMQDAGWVVTRSGSELIERQERYREALEALGSDEEADAEDRELGFYRIETLLADHLGWSTDQIQSDPNLLEGYTRELPELGETLQPSAVVPAAAGDGAQLLVQELPLLTALDQKVSGGEHLWRASAQERFERLLRETGVEAGLLFNGSQLRLVVAPKGESSGHITFSLKDLAKVSGRLMFSGLDLLLGQSHVFLDPDGYRLADVLRKSRSFQAVVSNALADQVLAALWELLRGFQQADELSQRQGGLLLGHLAEDDPRQLYGGLITVLMRLVFLLYAEDNALLPKDAVYEQNYKVSGVFERLEQDAAEFPDTMEQRYGAWAGLMSLCQLVFAGGGATVDYLSARKGQLFDPAVYPWLETPWISDGVVHEVLSNLLVVKGERISYRALDVEQIGSVYEGIMGYAVRRIPGRCIGLKSKPQGAKKQLTTAVDLDALLALPGGKRKAWLEEEAATTLPPKSANALKAATSEAELLEALAPRINHELFDGPQAAGSLVFQPTAERRRSGSHYTPRALTEPIVAEAFRPWLERCNHKPTADQILALKVCDPAMGSGAFLVAVCRFLARWLVEAWERDGYPDDFREEWDKDIVARRRIAQSCLYGVDKNPFAVNLAKLSLWLVTLSKELPFTFVDHALKCGDSLVGYSVKEIRAAMSQVQLGFLDAQNRIYEQMGLDRRETFAFDSLSDADYDSKKLRLEEQIKATEGLRQAGDLMVAAFFAKAKPRERADKQQVYLAMLSGTFQDDELAKTVEEIRDQLAAGDKGIRPFHWDLEFPEVFGDVRGGFDVFVGNPPFAGHITLASSSHTLYTSYLRSQFTGSSGKCDLVAYFFRKCFLLLADQGSLSLLATNSIAQGDTRESGLLRICEDGGHIYCARRSVKWPGAAAVSISIVHIHRGSYTGTKFLDAKRVERISALLLRGGPNNCPPARTLNLGIAFQGSTLLGHGFTIIDQSDADMETPGTPLPLSVISEIEDTVRGNRVIYPFIGGEDVNNRSDLSPSRLVISLGDIPEDEARRECPKIMELLEKKVKPDRLVSAAKSKTSHASRALTWWQHYHLAKDLYEKARSLKRVFVTASAATKHLTFPCLAPDLMYSNKLAVFCCDDYAFGGILNSTVHKEFAKLFSSTLEDRLTYSLSDSFINFPFPPGILPLDSRSFDLDYADKLERFRKLSESFYDFRLHVQSNLEIGLTKLYNLVNSPSCRTSQILELRKYHIDLDSLCLDLYGFSSADSAYGFVLDPASLEDLDDVDLAEHETPLFVQTSDDADRLTSSLAGLGLKKSQIKWSFAPNPDFVDECISSILLYCDSYPELVPTGRGNVHTTAGNQLSMYM